MGGGWWVRACITFIAATGLVSGDINDVLNRETILPIRFSRDVKLRQRYQGALTPASGFLEVRV